MSDLIEHLELIFGERFYCDYKTASRKGWRTMCLFLYVIEAKTMQTYTVWKMLLVCFGIIQCLQCKAII